MHCRVKINFFNFNSEFNVLIQELSYLWIKLVRGSMSFFPSRGSSGVNAPNYEYI